MQNSPTSTVNPRRLVSGAILLCLLIFSAGCAQNPLVESRKTEKERPPASLYLQTPVADWPERATNGELIDLARTLRRQVQECNADKASIEKWAAGAVPETKPEPPASARAWWKFWN
jgi:hypothetical protein